MLQRVGDDRGGGDGVTGPALYLPFELTMHELGAGHALQLQILGLQLVLDVKELGLCP